MNLLATVLVFAVTTSSLFAQAAATTSGGVPIVPASSGRWAKFKTQPGGAQAGTTQNSTTQSKSSAQSKADKGAATPAVNSAGLRVISQVEPPETWRKQVATARQRLTGAPIQSLRKSLRSRDQAEVFAALSFESEGKASFPEADLISLMKYTRSRLVGRGTALLLSRRGTAAAHQSLLAHVERKGPADDTALELLLQAGFRGGKQVLLERASNARSSNKADLLAIRALAFQPGDEVIVVLRRLQQDWAEEVQQAASQALELRKKAGIKATLPIRKPPVGGRPEEVAYREGYNPHPRKTAAAGRNSHSEGEEGPDDTAGELAPVDLDN